MNKNRIKSERMIFSLPPHIQMAIKLKSVKGSISTGEVIVELIEKYYPDLVKEARQAISEREK